MTAESGIELRLNETDRERDKGMWEKTREIMQYSFHLQRKRERKKNQKQSKKELLW